MKSGFNSEILSKKGQTIRGNNGYYSSREWKIFPEDYETLQKFVVGFKVINGLSIIRYRQDKHQVLLDVSDETQSVSLNDIQPRDIQPTDNFYHQKGIYREESNKRYWGGIKKWGTPDVLSEGFELIETLKKEKTEKIVESFLKEYEKEEY